MDRLLSSFVAAHRHSCTRMLPYLSVPSIYLPDTSKEKHFLCPPPDNARSCIEMENQITSSSSTPFLFISQSPQPPTIHTNTGKP